MVFLKLKFKYTYKKAENLPENYIVLANHLTDYDMLFVAAAFPRQMYFVGSEHISRWKYLGKLIKFLFEPIMRYKGSVASSTVMDILRKVRKGNSVCVFAEGVRSWDGTTSPILPSTAKLIKKANCGLITFKITGAYFVSPMWSGASLRKGPVHGEIANIYTKEQIAQMTNDEVYAAIVGDLQENAYERQLANPQKYKGKALAEHLENLIFICPECHEKDTLVSSGDTVRCKKCGLEFKYDEYGMLSNIPFQTVYDVANWQKAMVQKDIENGVIYQTPKANISTVKNHQEEFIATGELLISSQSLKCAHLEFPIDDISELAMHGQHTIVCTVNKDYYEIKTDKTVNTLKFLLYYNGLKTK